MLALPFAEFGFRTPLLQDNYNPIFRHLQDHLHRLIQKGFCPMTDYKLEIKQIVDYLRCI